ncbi:MAG: hypothetical protein U9P90_02260 [Patescibacteria group bacterium]|nr:hypothetical protein [Patescibacteria group bacterium]
MKNKSANEIKKIIYDSFNVSANFTRPANTTAYAQYDAMNNSTSAPVVLTFSDVGAENGENVLIQEVSIKTTNGASLLPDMNLWLFSESVTATNDNSEMSLTDAHNLLILDVIPLTDSYKAALNGIAKTHNISSQIKLKSTSKNIYGLLQADAAYTPISEEVFTINISGMRLS